MVQETVGRYIIQVSKVVLGDNTAAKGKAKGKANEKPNNKGKRKVIIDSEDEAGLAENKEADGDEFDPLDLLDDEISDDEWRRISADLDESMLLP
jgi:hypothetical protein